MGAAQIPGLNNYWSKHSSRVWCLLLPICTSAGSATIASEQEQTGKHQQLDVAPCQYLSFAVPVSSSQPGFYCPLSHHWETWRRPGQPAACSIDHFLCMCFVFFFHQSHICSQAPVRSHVCGIAALELLLQMTEVSFRVLVEVVLISLMFRKLVKTSWSLSVWPTIGRF